ncbi:MAG: hypothetical protein DLM50_07050 [Candidatus Meridianibacter frigidus]|nr:MAG: hypothetical protein DLM50_07050 [Candidatus Eremiobacteraeota bacterium]
MRTVSFLAFFVLLLGSNPAGAAVTADSSFKAVLATKPLPLDPSLSDPQWKAGAIGSDFQNLTVRKPANLKTSVSLLYDAHNLYVGFHAEQAGIPISATQTANNIGFGLDDFVGIGIDPSGNGSQAYFFEVTPRGVRYQQASENARYLPAWQSAAQIQGDSWNAVMIIPLSILRYHAGALSTWRINFVRQIAANGEHYTWAFDGTMADAIVPQWPGFADARFWPALTGLQTSGAGIARARTHGDFYALSSTGSDRKLFAQSNGTFLPEDIRHLGVDFTQPITSTISFVGTLNPDFSNVELDQQTIAPQEFRRALQEYRPFFAQGANLINANVAPGNSFVQPLNTVFYSPSVGPFDRGAKVEGTFGDQSFGVLSFRGYNQLTNDEFDDTAFGYKHSLPNHAFIYFADGVMAHHSTSGNDSTFEVGTEVRDQRTGFVGTISTSVETGSWVPAPGHAQSTFGFLDIHKPNYEVNLGYQDITPNYNPIDGFTVNSDIRGPTGFLSFNGNGKKVKNWALSLFGDRFTDRSGEVHQADSYVNLQAQFNNQFSINIGPQVGILRGYSLPAVSGDCSVAGPDRSYFTGYPCYLNGRSDRFDLMQFGFGYRDGTPTPIDLTWLYGPFSNYELHQFILTTSRPLGKHLSFSAEYDGSQQAFFDGGHDSQFLRRVSLGDSIDPDTNLSVSLRDINGTGGFAIPGLNLTLSLHHRFKNEDELFVNYGTPAATQTLNRLIVKYLFHFGGGAGI